jgi:hypothetical protein
VTHSSFLIKYLNPLTFKKGGDFPPSLYPFPAPFGGTEGGLVRGDFFLKQKVNDILSGMKPST